MIFFKKKDRVIDLSESMRRKQDKLNSLKAEMKENASAVKGSDNFNAEPSGGSFFSFMGNQNAAASAPGASEENYSREDSDDKRQKLAKRLSDITAKLEDLSNSIYKIEQRLELIERKIGVGKY